VVGHTKAYMQRHVKWVTWRNIRPTLSECRQDCRAGQMIAVFLVEKNHPLFAKPWRDQKKAA